MIDTSGSIRTAQNLQEIELIRETAKEKQTQDNTKLEILAKEINNLSVELEKARTESLTDGMTGIYNRKAFDRHIIELVEKNTVSKAPFALLMLDTERIGCSPKRIWTKGGKSCRCCWQKPVFFSDRLKTTDPVPMAYNLIY